MENDIASLVVLDGATPFLWHTVRLSQLTPEQRERAIIARQCNVHIGVTFAFHFMEGQGIGGLGLCAGGMNGEQFQRVWDRHSDEMVALANAFDAAMRPRMVANRLRLTNRQREVLAYSSAGMTAKQIAHHLGISSKTVSNTLGRAMKALDAVSTMEAVAKALVYKLII